MPRENFQASMDELRQSVLGLGDDVVGQVERGLSALRRGDEQLARSIINGDAAINQRYLDLESDCIDLLALQHPVASDLRFVASSFKVLTDLERIGDLATNFGKYTLGSTRDSRIDTDLDAIGDDTVSMVNDALTAYESENVELCFSLEARDEDLDTLCMHASEQIVRDLIERDHQVDTWAVEQLLDDVSRVLLTIRDLERVGDHAVNIAARTLYMAEGSAELIY